MWWINRFESIAMLGRINAWRMKDRRVPSKYLALPPFCHCLLIGTATWSDITLFKNDFPRGFSRPRSFVSSRFMGTEEEKRQSGNSLHSEKENVPISLLIDSNSSWAQIQTHDKVHLSWRQTYLKRLVTSFRVVLGVSFSFFFSFLFTSVSDEEEELRGNAFLGTVQYFNQTRYLAASSSVYFWTCNFRWKKRIAARGRCGGEPTGIKMRSPGIINTRLSGYDRVIARYRSFVRTGAVKMKCFW